MSKNKKKKYINFRCHACAAMNTKILINSSTTKTITIPNKRPSHCALCSVTTGMHAMHMLYDTHGKFGRPLILPASAATTNKEAKQERVAWVHTLCASFIGKFYQSRECVYGCQKNGKYGEDDDDDDDDDDNDDDDDDSDMDTAESESESGNCKMPILNQDIILPSELKAKTHHYVIAGKEEDKATVWTRTTYLLRKGIKCSFCFKIDTKSLRIPLQCSAGSDDEHLKFRHLHADLRHTNESCFVGFHIGCARWARTIAHPRIHLRPDVDVIEQQLEKKKEQLQHNMEMITECYCNAHAPAVSKICGYIRPRPNKSSSSSSLPSTLPTSSMTERGKRETRGNTNKLSSLNNNKKKGKLDNNSSRKRSNSSSSIKEVDHHAHAHATKKQRSSSFNQINSKQFTNSATSTNNIPSNTTSTTNTTKKKNTTTTHDENSEYNRRKKWLEKMYEDILQDVTTQINKAKLENRDVIQATKRCKAFWRDNYDINKTEFERLWKKIKIVVKANFENVAANANTNTVLVNNDGAPLMTTAGTSENVTTSLNGNTGSFEGKNTGGTVNTPAISVINGVADTGNKDSPTNSGGAQRTTADRWSSLFKPHYKGVFEFDEWDSLEHISQSSMITLVE